MAVLRAKYRHNGSRVACVHGQVHRAVKSGKLLRPRYCQSCGCGNRVLHGHHNNYKLPLDVEWLCPYCHIQRHRAMKHKGFKASDSALFLRLRRKRMLRFIAASDDWGDRYNLPLTFYVLDAVLCHR